MKVDIGPYKKIGDRKVKVSISSDDTYSLDYTLALVILPALKKYKEHACNKVIWGSLFPENYHELSKKEQNKIEKQASKKMKEIIDKMIYSFEKIANDDVFFTDPKKEQQIQEGLDLFAEYFRGLWW